MKRILLILLSITIQIFPQNVSQYAGGAGNVFLRVNFSASGTAMGNAATGYPVGINSLFYNPAGMALKRGIVMGLNHYQWIEDIRFDNFSVIYQPNYRFALAGGISAMWMPPLQGKDQNGNITGELNVFSGVAYAGIGLQFHPSVYGGVTVKYFYDYLGGYAAKGFAVDVGYFMYTFINGLTFGAAVQNIGQKIKYYQQETDLPLTARLGFSYRVASSGLRFNVDVVKARDTDVYYNVGMEYNLFNVLTLRAGNQFKMNTMLPTAGVGLVVSDEYTANYSFLAMEDLGPVHQFGLIIRLGRAPQYVRKSPPAYPAPLATATEQAQVKIDGSKLLLQWPTPKSGQSVVYIRLSGKTPWKKVKAVVGKNILRFKKPQMPGVYEFKINNVNKNNEIENTYYAQIRIQAS